MREEQKMNIRAYSATATGLSVRSLYRRNAFHYSKNWPCNDIMVRLSKTKVLDEMQLFLQEVFLRKSCIACSSSSCALEHNIQVSASFTDSGYYFLSWFLCPSGLWSLMAVWYLCGEGTPYSSWSVKSKPHWAQSHAHNRVEGERGSPTVRRKRKRHSLGKPG